MRNAPVLTGMDLRFDVAVRIMSNWELGQIVEQPNSTDGVARLALDLADALVKGARERDWLPPE
jgi:hypothetical protein